MLLHCAYGFFLPKLTNLLNNTNPCSIVANIGFIKIPQVDNCTRKVDNHLMTQKKDELSMAGIAN